MQNQKPQDERTDLRDEDAVFMELALELAEQAEEAGEVPIGAVVVSGGEVVGRGRNRIEEQGSATAHAEMLALQEACALLGRRLSDCTLYSTVEPCAMCAGAIILARVGRVVFGAVDPKFGAGGSVVNLLECERFNHQPEVTRGVLAERCGELLQRFFRRLRAGE